MPTKLTGLRLALALQSARMFVWDSVVPRSGLLQSTVFWNDGGLSLLGLEPERAFQPFENFQASVHPDDRQHMLAAMEAAIRTRGGYEVEYRVIWPDRTVHWLAARAEVITSARGKSVRTLGLIWDITERKCIESELARQRELAQITLSSIAEGVITTNAHGIVQTMNRAAEEITGWEYASLGRDTPITRIFKVYDERTMEPMENVALRCMQLKHAIMMPTVGLLATADERRVPIEDSAAPIRAPDGRILGAVIVLRDVSHERALKEQMGWHAAHDPLTELINRREFEQQVGMALTGAKQEGIGHVLMYLDLDRFKLVNDTCGHQAGDVLLKILAKLLQSRMRESDVLARLGGDEFGALLRNCPLEQACRLADKLRQTVRDFRFAWDRYHFEIGVSIGVVVVDEDSKSLSELLSNADQACYMAKELGRNRVHVYRETDASLTKRRSQALWVSRLHHALDGHHFVLYSQPIISLSEPGTHHAEVLIRMLGSSGELVPPGAFIPAAERYDVMPRIDRWVISAVCQWLERSTAEPGGNASSRYAINLSGASLADRHLLDFIQQTLNRHRVAPWRLCFEITETALISNLDKAGELVQDLKAKGCEVALDDFGSGLSSFGYLKALPVDYLKIDGVFIRDIIENPVNRELTAAINQIGHVMGMRTIAEYVESPAILDMVRSMGIDYAQGNAIGTAQRIG